MALGKKTFCHSSWITCKLVFFVFICIIIILLAASSCKTRFYYLLVFLMEISRLLRYQRFYTYQRNLKWGWKWISVHTFLLFVCSSGYILFYCRIVFLELKNRLFCLVPRQYNLSDIEGKIIAIWHCFEPNNIHTHKKGGRSVWRREEGEKNWWQGVKIKCIDALLLFEKKERFVAHTHTYAIETMLS